MFLSPESSYIYVLAVLMSSINVLSGPSRGSYVPDLVNKAKLLKANTLIQSSSSLASIIGALVAGGIVLISDPAYVFILQSSCLIISSDFIGFTRHVIS